MEDMDLPHPRSLSQSKHGMKGSNLSQQYATNTPNEFIKIYILGLTASQYDFIAYHVLGHKLLFDKYNIASINVANMFPIVHFINSELFCACTRNITKCIFHIYIIHLF